MDTIWKDIPGFEGLYKVSICGKYVYSYRSDKNIYIDVDYKGYCNVRLYLDGKKYKFKLHRVVMATFAPVDNPEDYDVNHIDGDKLNNALWNLEYLTHLENMRHYFEHLRCVMV